jgi:hypothetical protein
VGNGRRNLLVKCQGVDLELSPGSVVVGIETLRENAVVVPVWALPHDYEPARWIVRDPGAALVASGDCIHLEFGPQRHRVDQEQQGGGAATTKASFAAGHIRV